MKRIQEFIDSDEVDTKMLVRNTAEAPESIGAVEKPVNELLRNQALRQDLKLANTKHQILTKPMEVGAGISSGSEYAIQIHNHSFSWGVKNDEEENEDGKASEDAASNKKKAVDTLKSTKDLEKSQKEPLIPDDLEEGAPKAKERNLDSIITLKELDLKIPHGKFVCIIGNVGSGKSSLLSTLIGDLLYVSPAQI